MKRLSSGVAALLVTLSLSGGLIAAPVFETTAHASTNTSRGLLTSFTWNADTHVGHLVLDTPKGLKGFRVTSITDCGVSTGQSGDSIHCRTLGRDKYHNKPTKVRWRTSAHGARKAIQVVVDLS